MAESNCKLYRHLPKSPFQLKARRMGISVFLAITFPTVNYYDNGNVKFYTNADHHGRVP